VDTPEPDAGECFSGEATAANERLLAGRQVRLVLDAEERDRYGRLLAYVYAGDVFVNARLLREGFAEPIVVRPNDRFAVRFAALARDARRERRGLWASCSS
jgi:micrococcal nuclease